MYYPYGKWTFQGLIVLCSEVVLFSENLMLHAFLLTVNPCSNYRDEQDENEDDLAPPSSGIPPPDYSPTTIGPPVYEDALQDVILSSGTGEQT